MGADSLHQAEQLRRSVEEVAGRQPHFGERLPRRWLHCDQSLDQLNLSALNFCSLAQVTVHSFSFSRLSLFLSLYLSPCLSLHRKGNYQYDSLKTRI